jgi:hypothetical protein
MSMPWNSTLTDLVRPTVSRSCQQLGWFFRYRPRSEPERTPQARGRKFSFQLALRRAGGQAIGKPHRSSVSIMGSISRQTPRPAPLRSMTSLSRSAVRADCISSCAISARDPPPLFGPSDQLAAGIFITRGDGRIVELNQAADGIIRRNDGLTIRNGKLCALRAFEDAKLATLIAGAVPAGTGSAAGRMLVGRRGGRAAYIVSVTPLGVHVAPFDRPLAWCSPPLRTTAFLRNATSQNYLDCLGRRSASHRHCSKVKSCMTSPPIPAFESPHCAPNSAQF